MRRSLDCGEAEFQLHQFRVLRPGWWRNRGTKHVRLFRVYSLTQSLDSGPERPVLSPDYSMYWPDDFVQALWASETDQPQHGIMGPF